MVKVTQIKKGTYEILGYEYVNITGTIEYFRIENADLSLVKKFLKGRNIDDLELSYGFERLRRVNNAVNLHEDVREVVV